MSVEIEIECSGCGESMDTTTSVSKWGDVRVIVAPCEKCLESAKEDSESEGYARGKVEGNEEGYERGKTDAASGAAGEDVTP